MSNLKTDIFEIKDIQNDKLLKSIVGLSDNEVFLMPMSSFRGVDKYTYEEGTYDLFNYLKSNSDKDIKLAFYDYYYENVMHSEVLRIASLVVTSVTFPIVIGLLTNYIYDKISHHGSSSEDIKLDMSIKVKKNEKIIDIKYEGEVSDLANVINEIKDLVNDK